MSSSTIMTKWFMYLLRIAILLAAVPAALALGRFGQYPIVVSALFLVVGEIALLLMGFTIPEMREALREIWKRKRPNTGNGRSACFFEAAARNALGLGVLGTLGGFAIQISSPFGTPDLFMGAMADTVLTTVYALALAAVFNITALRLRGSGEGGETFRWQNSPEPSHDKRTGWVSWIGSALFCSLILWVVLAPSTGGPFTPSDCLAAWPAWLTVLGGAAILGLFLGDPKNGSVLTLGFAYAGGISALLGLVRALNGFSQTDISLVASGCTWMISSCFAALVGMLAIAASRQDRARQVEAAPTWLAWYGLPAVSLLFLALVVLMIMTPITANAH